MATALLPATPSPFWERGRRVGVETVTTRGPFFYLRTPHFEQRERVFCEIAELSLLAEAEFLYCDTPHDRRDLAGRCALHQPLQSCSSL